MSEESRTKGMEIIGKLFGAPASDGLEQPQPLERYTFTSQARRTLASIEPSCSA